LHVPERERHAYDSPRPEAKLFAQAMKYANGAKWTATGQIFGNLTYLDDIFQACRYKQLSLEQRTDRLEIVALRKEDSARIEVREGEPASRR
jgi:hypothetical protein